VINYQVKIPAIQASPVEGFGLHQRFLVDEYFSELAAFGKGGSQMVSACIEREVAMKSLARILFSNYIQLCVKGACRSDNSGTGTN
jgi:hypothetical protein